jgi:hypothetical protein
MQDHQHVLGPRHGDVEQTAVPVFIARGERRGQEIGPEQQYDAELQTQRAVHGQDLHGLVTQRAGRVVARRQHRAGEAVQSVEEGRHRRIRPPARIQHADITGPDALAPAADLQAAEQPGRRAPRRNERRSPNCRADQPGFRRGADRGIRLDRDASLGRHH